MGHARRGHGKIPCALIDDFAVQVFPTLDVFLGIYQRESGTGTTGISVRPIISIRRKVCCTSSASQASAGDDGDAQDIRIGGLHDGRGWPACPSRRGPKRPDR